MRGHVMSSKGQIIVFTVVFSEQYPLSCDLLSITKTFPISFNHVFHNVRNIFGFNVAQFSSGLSLANHLLESRHPKLTQPMLNIQRH